MGVDAVSVTTLRTLWCDVPKCGVWEYAPHDEQNARELRRALRKRGWRRVAGKDLCPACVREVPISEGWAP